MFVGIWEMHEGWTSPLSGFVIKQHPNSSSMTCSEELGQWWPWPWPLEEGFPLISTWQKCF